MTKLLPVALLALSGVLWPLHAHALAASRPSSRLMHVNVQLAGPPLAADANLKVRDRATHSHLRLDSTLPAARWYTQTLQQYQTREIAYLKGQGLDLTVGRQFQILFNGFSATIPAAQVGRLQSRANVSAVMPVRRYHLLLSSALPLVHASVAWDQLGGGPQAGRGMKIAMIDSGVDITNPCFRDNDMPPPGNGFPRADTQDNLRFTNNKVIVARAFGDTGKTYSAADQGGHGTFTSSIAACDYNTTTPLGTKISGVAPAAYLMSYNVFPGGGSQTSSDDPVLPALEAAFKDGADVVNMSLGSSILGGDIRVDADSLATGLLTKAGIPVVVSAGNAGPTIESVGSPGVAPEAITVGATSNATAVTQSVVVNNPSPVPASLARIPAIVGTDDWSGKAGPAEAVDVGLGRKPGDDSSSTSADDYAGKDVKGKIALIQRGSITFATKLANAAKAGAVGVVVYDNREEASLITPIWGSTNLPHLFISQKDGQALLAWIKANPDATITLDSTLMQVDRVPNVIADFSSRGYGANYTIKPDVVAPGKDIYAATESSTPSGEFYNKDGFASANGTSGAAPFVTGAAALVLQKHPQWTPVMVKSAITNTASPDVYADTGQTATPPIMQIGSGLLNVGAAVTSPALATPGSLSFGEYNIGTTSASPTLGLSLLDAGGGSGTWQVAVNSVHGGGAVQLSVPSTISVGSGAAASIAVTLTVSSTAAQGDYDGFITFTQGSHSLHVPYFVHVVNQPITRGTVLLVDDTSSLFQTAPPASPVRHLDVSHYYESALQSLHRPYTYWNEAVLGPPTLGDLVHAAAAIYFTGNNLNGFGPDNSDPESLSGPLNATDVTAIHSYLDKGGRVFINGMGAAISDLDWSAVVLGAGADSLSLYDSSQNDKKHTGGISPPRPSAVRDTRPKVAENPWLFSGLQPVDFSTKGDGARDNLAIYNSAVAASDSVGLVGVAGLEPLRGTYKASETFHIHGLAALRTTNLSLQQGGQDVSVVSSDEPTLTHNATYAGRSVLFSFGWEGINNNTGYATREQVLQRVLAWLSDKPSATVSNKVYPAHRPVRLAATLRGGSRAVQYVWQVGGNKLRATSTPTTYTFPHAGTYRTRVLITDALGHNAVSKWVTVRVR